MAFEMRTLFPFLGLFVIQMAWVDAQDNSPSVQVAAGVDRAKLVDVLRGAVASGEAPNLYELVGRSEKVVEYDSGIDSSEIIGFRLQQDKNDEFLCWAVKVKQESFPQGDSTSDATPGKSMYFGVSVRGSRLTRFSEAAPTPQSIRFETFDQAKAAAEIPNPVYFGVVSYDLSRDSAKGMRRLESRILSPNSTVRVEALPEGARYIMRNQESDVKYHTYTWTFRSPGYLPQSLTIDQSTTGELVRIRSQRVFWEKSAQGRYQPFRVAIKSPVARQNASGGYDVGHKSIDVELIWLEETQVHRMDFASVIDVRKYLEIGEAIAKQKTAKPSQEN